MKKIVLMISFLFIFTLSKFIIVEASSYTYNIDTTNYYKLTSSIFNVVSSSQYNPDDLSKFYLVLYDVQNETTLTPQELLNKYSISYRYSVSNSLYTASVSWKYSKDVYQSGTAFDGNSETKSLVLDMQEIKYEFISSGDTRRIGEPKCPVGWTKVTSGGGGPVTPEPYSNDNFSILSSIETTTSTSTNCRKNSSGYTYYKTTKLIKFTSDYFIRKFVDNQSKYGFSGNYQPKIDISYDSGAIAPNVTMTLIDSDKLIINDNGNEFYILREDHYERNNYNLSFPLLYSRFKDYYKDQYDCKEKGLLWYSVNLIDSGYFHRLGEFNGDTSNLGNRKFTCDIVNEDINLLYPNASYEVVYSEDGYIENSPVVHGTFNFSNNTHEHYQKDVYPYLIWGNSLSDNSNLKERLVWDENSSGTGVWDFDGKLYTYRGESLFSRGNINNSLSVEYYDVEYNGDNSIPIISYRLSNNPYYGYSGSLPSGGGGGGPTPEPYLFPNIN